MFDIAGVLFLVGLIAIFSFLTVRVWKTKNRWLKWIGTLLFGLLALIPAALLVLALLATPIVAILIAARQSRRERREEEELGSGL